MYSCDFFKPHLPPIQRFSLHQDGFAVEADRYPQQRFLLQLALVGHPVREDQLPCHRSSSFHFSELVNCSSSEGVPNAGW
jgi:hypothetical protein